MLDERKAAILRTIVEEYIQTAQPVGSTHLVAARHLQVSSATIRNDMAMLERDGFLHQPHTSAGRVPTDKGYRYFVDNFGHAELGQSDTYTVKAFFDRAHNRLEQMLADTSRMLSNLTSYAAVVVGPPQQMATVRSIHLVRLADALGLCVVVFSNGSVERHTLEFDPELSDVELNAASLRLATAFIDRSSSDPLESLNTGEPRVDALVEMACAACRDTDPAPVYVGGASKMATAFVGAETLHAVLSVLEEQYVVISLLRDVLDRGLNVAIGTETGVAPLAECSLVVAPYIVEGQARGSIGVLGPTRMNYPQTLAAVAVVSTELGERLSRG